MYALERAVFSKQISAKKNHRPLPSLPPRSRAPHEMSTVSQLVTQ